MNKNGWTNTTRINLDPIIFQYNDITGRVEALTDWMGWCLAVAQNIYSAGYSGTTALNCWNANIGGGNHADRNIPIGVKVPLFFSGFWGAGHVLVVEMNERGGGIAWTSPNTNKPSVDALSFNSLDELIARMKNEWARDLNYLGWSEYLGPTRVVEQINQGEEILKPSKAEIIDTFEMYLLEQPKNQEQINYYLNQDVRILYRDVLGATKPKINEIDKAFKELLPGTSDPNRIAYYSSRNAKQLYMDIAGALRRQIVKDTKPAEFEQVKDLLYRKK